MSAVAAIVALPVSAALLWLLLRTPAIGKRLVAHPTRERWHDRPTPTFGGVGIVAGLLTGIGAAVAAGAVEASWQLGGIVAGCVVLFGAGLLDDVRNLSPKAKLAAQVLAASLAAAAGLRLELVGNDVVAGAIAVVWLVGITNAFNLLDNMDGLAATLASIACAYFAVDAITRDRSGIALVIPLCLGLACAGFLPFNLRPRGNALVFMGDSGSQVLGFLLAALGIISSWKAAGATVATIVLPLLVLAVPILDTTLVTIMRTIERRPVSQGGRDHTSHRLVYYGLSETRAVGFLAVVALLVGATSVAYNVLDRPQVTAVGLMLTFVLLVQLGGFLSEVDERARRGQAADMSWRHAFAFEPRRLAEVVVDFIVVCGCLGAAYLVIVRGRGTDAQVGTFLALVPVVLGTRYVVFLVLRIYRRAWRYARAADLVPIVVGCVLSEAIAVGIFAVTRDLDPLPSGIFLVDAALCAAAVSLSRVAIRFLPEAHGAHEERTRVVVLGAGPASRTYAREAAESGRRVVIGFIDDDRRLRRRRVHGVPVLGGLDELPGIVAATRAGELVVPGGNEPENLAQIERAATAAGVPVRFGTT